MKLVISLIIIGLLAGCAVSGVIRQGVEQSTDEFAKWTELFKVRLDKMPDQEIAPFCIWIVAIIGQDKEKLPREGEKLVDKIYTTVTSKPDDYKFSKRERAELMGAWDRIFIILYEEAGKRGMSLMKKLMMGGLV